METDLSVAVRATRAGADIAVRYFAALSIIVDEAGGRYSGADGDRRPTDGPSFYARTATIGADAVRMVTARG